MPQIIPESKIIEAVEKETFIKNGKVGNVEGVKYDFRLSSKILKSKYKKPIDVNQISEIERAGLAIEPGEVVFALTEETIDLPINMIANLSPKRKLGHDGILIITGFCVDPLYCGKLLIGMYNFSSSPYPLLPGRKLIASLFYELKGDEIEEFKSPEACIEDFPDDIIKLMQKYKPATTQSLIDEVKNIKFQLDEIRTDFKNREDWFKKYQESLDKNENHIEKILDLINREVQDRRDADRALDDRVRDVDRNIAKYSKEAYKIAAIVGTIGALLISLFLKLLVK